MESLDKLSFTHILLHVRYVTVKWKEKLLASEIKEQTQNEKFRVSCLTIWIKNMDPTEMCKDIKCM